MSKRTGTLKELWEFMRGGEIYIVSEGCEIILHSKADEKGNPVSPHENPTRFLEAGCEVQMQGCGKTNGVKLQLPTELVWVGYDELQKIKAEVKSMEDKRKLEIALAILTWRYRQLGTERFMGELKAVVKDTDVPDDEMLAFLKSLSDNMREEKKKE
jgi:hypothetical protein